MKKIKANQNVVINKNGKAVLVKKAKTGLLIECSEDFVVVEKTDAKLTASEKEQKAKLEKKTKTK